MAATVTMIVPVDEEFSSELLIELCGASDAGVGGTGVGVTGDRNGGEGGEGAAGIGGCDGSARGDDGDGETVEPTANCGSHVHDDAVSVHVGAVYADQLVAEAGEYTGGELHAFVALSTHAASTESRNATDSAVVSTPSTVRGPACGAQLASIIRVGVVEGQVKLVLRPVLLRSVPGERYVLGTWVVVWPDEQPLTLAQSSIDSRPLPKIASPPNLGPPWMGTVVSAELSSCRTAMARV